LRTSRFFELLPLGINGFLACCLKLLLLVECLLQFSDLLVYLVLKLKLKYKVNMMVQRFVVADDGYLFEVLKGPQPSQPNRTG